MSSPREASAGSWASGRTRTPASRSAAGSPTSAPTLGRRRSMRASPTVRLGGRARGYDTLPGMARHPCAGETGAEEKHMHATVAYHFVGSTLRDGRPVPPDGVWLEHDGPIAIRESGLHASRRPWHALQFAPGETLCLVEVAGIVEEERNKLVARRRRIVRRA